MKKRQSPKPMCNADKEFILDFYESHKRLMYYLAKRYTTSPTDAEDLVQDSLLRLIHNVSTIKRLEPEKAARYVALTVKTTFLDYEKTRHKELMLYIDDSDFERILEKQLPELDVEHNISVRMSIAQLREKMPLREWIILEGKYITGLSDEEIGSMVGVAASSVRMLLHRSRETARSILGDDAVIGIGGE